MIYSFPKIWHLGDRNAKNIFVGAVEVTEKIDGSQFNFGRFGSELYCRSKGKDIVLDAPEKMFKKAVDFCIREFDNMTLPDGLVFHCEYLNKPKHNTLVYDRVPRNNLMCFGVSKPDGTFYLNHAQIAREVGLEPVPVLFEGIISDPDQLKELLNTESVLGGTKVEGVVVKNYAHQVLIGDRHIPLLTVKYVSEMFKEKHTGWKKEHTSKGRLDTFIESFRHEGRWKKAVQHLRDNGELTSTPKDIGLLIKEIQADIEAEEKEVIKEQLWKEYGTVIKRKSVAGFPEWYKEQLMQEVFSGE